VLFQGSCLCGGIRYEVRGSLNHVTHCHCSMCRKAHGAAFATYGRVETGDFVVTSGADDLVSYQSSPEVTRTFCKHCGSTLQFIYTDRPGSLWLALGTLDDDPGIQAVQHIFVGSKAPWSDITDDLPQHLALP
jgi:hypothetical protein